MHCALCTRMFGTVTPGAKSLDWTGFVMGERFWTGSGRQTVSVITVSVMPLRSGGSCRRSDPVQKQHLSPTADVNKRDVKSVKSVYLVWHQATVKDIHCLIDHKMTIKKRSIKVEFFVARLPHPCPWMLPPPTPLQTKPLCSLSLTVPKRNPPYVKWTGVCLFIHLFFDDVAANSISASTSVSQRHRSHCHRCLQRTRRVD